MSMQTTFLYLARMVVIPLIALKSQLVLYSICPLLVWLTKRQHLNLKTLTSYCKVSNLIDHNFFAAASVFHPQLPQAFSLPQGSSPQLPQALSLPQGSSLVARCTETPYRASIYF